MAQGVRGKVVRYRDEPKTPKPAALVAYHPRGGGAGAVGGGVEHDRIPADREGVALGLGEAGELRVEDDLAIAGYAGVNHTETRCRRLGEYTVSLSGTPRITAEPRSDHLEVDLRSLFRLLLPLGRSSLTKKVGALTSGRALLSDPSW